MKHYDLLVIGSGSGNTIIDDRFDDWSVAIVESGAYGGTCLNRGCIPSKMYVAAADRAHEAGANDGYGVQTSFAGADWPAIRDRIFGRIDPIAAGGQRYREGASNIDAIAGTARFSGPRQVVVDLLDGGTVELTADQVVLATGTRPVVPDIPGLDDVEHHTSDSILRLDALPARLGIVGGGYVGSELAHVFDGLGSHVVQINRSAKLLGSHDTEIAEIFTREVSQRWDVRLDTQVERVAPTDDGAITLHLDDGSTVEVDVLLFAAGRRPNSDLLHLGQTGIETGIEVGEDGLVVVDEFQHTSADGVWALGDASSHEPLKHAANQDARVVQHNLLHPDDRWVSDHRFVPNAVFTSPQVAAVGLTEAQARARGIDLAVARHAYGDIAHGWALLEDGTEHLVKLLADRATGLLVGAHLIGPQASNLVQPLIQAMSFGQPVVGLARGQYWIHPALTEVVENALLKLEDELSR